MAWHPWWRACTLTAGECIGDYPNGAGLDRPKVFSSLVCRAVARSLADRAGCRDCSLYPVVSHSEPAKARHSGVPHLADYRPGHWELDPFITESAIRYFSFPWRCHCSLPNIPERFWLRWRPWLAAYGVFLFIDTVTLQPYGYVWFNEWARFFANETNYDTDYWGYSLREAATLAKSLARIKSVDCWQSKPLGRVLCARALCEGHERSSPGKQLFTC